MGKRVIKATSKRLEAPGCILALTTTTTTTILTPVMIHFTTLLTLVVSGMEVVQPAAAKVLPGLTARIDLGPVDIGAFQRRQGIPQVPPQCVSICNPINSIIASGVSHAN